LVRYRGVPLDEVSLSAIKINPVESIIFCISSALNEVIFFDEEHLVRRSGSKNATSNSVAHPLMLSVFMVIFFK
jgi:hypothetical protein